MLNQSFQKNAFTLMELMIVVAIIGILAVLVIPSYQVYLRRAHYVAVIQAATPLKMSVQECFQVTSKIEDCGAGQNGVPTGNDTPTGLIQSAKIDSSGKITITPKAQYGFTALDTYTLTPIVQQDQLMWVSGGGGVAHGYAN